ncbi:NAD(P)-binding protein [Artomyces pyxidatus]|uniref:NAD(P)-binding protein n=1 Tax=Artomyces pyxidatus TaxID=48021 RepID=A0ACB8T9F1_9AGAM|nr:NAD(P)-binding protein [Artomyces pyxidatus]
MRMCALTPSSCLPLHLTQVFHGFEVTKFVGLNEEPAGSIHRPEFAFLSDVRKVNILRHIFCSIYPAIDPTPLFAGRAFQGKAVLVTSASRGIGAEIARHFARAGASVALLARNQVQLDDVKAGIEAECPGVHVLVLVADVKDPAKSASAVQATVQAFGRLDVLVANAGAMRPNGTRSGSVDPVEWRDTVEVNLRGPFNFIHSSVSHLQKSNGYVVAISFAGAQVRIPTASDYSLSKHAINGLVEFVPIGLYIYLFPLRSLNYDTYRVS